jgi:hypothetical protein
MLLESRSRLTELRLNGICLVRTLICLRLEKVPFFLLHLWYAVAK